MNLQMAAEWHTAAIEGDIGLLERLLAAGQDIDAPDRYGQTALMLAARQGRTEVVDLLLARQATLDVTEKYGLSALMLAIVNDHGGVAARLLEAGADTGLRGTGAPGFLGKTAADLATDAGLTALATTITSASQGGTRDD